MHVKNCFLSVEKISMCNISPVQLGMGFTQRKIIVAKDLFHIFLCRSVRLLCSVVITSN